MTSRDYEDHERKVLVGRTYTTLRSNWTEWAGRAFDSVCEEIAGRRADVAPKTGADEIIEVIVLRRAKVTSEVTVVEVDSDSCPS